uniref:Uncharacterized protein n=1 Tax=Chromera velia CCMP2878 TaxID=1169474 RepID=A0A0G4I4G1_9ALVE|eukprot:Cvel_1798.t1-p1 / transcript=Cvel_1798.t1 / gene=Cvel_1798 / organism=Chromera_velia_CCMP2878 / gene_product=hypothetical protein / transcript_product=hypothetical protein / location=Cvel_scaffold66:54735-57698(+) / protein_length=988 / sequence_SO=supercontig / SO=protein_coding / is_pseudo=false
MDTRSSAMKKCSRLLLRSWGEFRGISRLCVNNIQPVRHFDRMPRFFNSSDMVSDSFHIFRSFTSRSLTNTVRNDGSRVGLLTGELSVTSHSSFPSQTSQLNQIARGTVEVDTPANSDSSGTGSEAQKRYALEQAAVSLLRRAFRKTAHFEGLEEPPHPLPHFARADVAVRPVGCSEDLWLGVQVKSTAGPGRQAVSRQLQGAPFWCFKILANYSGMSVACVSLEQNEEIPPKAWLFPGSTLAHLKTHLKVTQGGMHDTNDSRCCFDHNRGHGSHVGESLLKTWREARAGKSLNRLYDLHSLQTQLSANHLAEWKALQKFRLLCASVHCRIEVREASSPMLPHDIEIRLAGFEEMGWQRVQLKSAMLVKKKRVAVVNSQKKSANKWVPYGKDDFDYILVSHPQNRSRTSGTPASASELTSQTISDFPDSSRGPFLYLIPVEELVKEGVVSGGEGGSKGVRTFCLHFSATRDTRAPNPRFRSTRLLKWRLDTSSLRVARRHMSEVLLSSGKRRFGTGSLHVAGGEEGKRAWDVFSSREDCVSKACSRSDEGTDQRKGDIKLEGEKAEVSRPYNGDGLNFQSQAENPVCLDHRTMSLQERYAVERAALTLLRETFKSTTHFAGLEEPVCRLPAFAKADLAVRPIGCTEDMWLPIQIKSTKWKCHSRQASENPAWNFQRVRGYEGVPIVCISLEMDSLCLPTPRVWLFSGDLFNIMKHPGMLRITQGGKYDTAESRCSFEGGQSNFPHIGENLYMIWKRARQGIGGYRLNSLQSIQSQQSPTHLKEWKMREKCVDLFKAAPEGVEVKGDDPCPSLPYDLEIRLRDRPEMTWQRVQLKSSRWHSKSPFALVDSRKLVGGKTQPYEEGDFNFLLVGPPQNQAQECLRDSSQRSKILRDQNCAPNPPFSEPKNHPSDRYFYFIPEKVLIDEGIIASKRREISGLHGFHLDFLVKPAAVNPNRAFRLLDWRLDVLNGHAGEKMAYTFRHYKEDTLN